MGWIDTFESLLDAKSDAELKVKASSSEEPVQCKMHEIDMELAFQLILDGAGNWKLRKTLKDNSGVHICKKQVRRLRELVRKKQQERDLILNPPEDLV